MLVLSAASFATEKSSGSVTLTFDRAVDVTGFNNASLTVDASGFVYVATGVAFHLDNLVVIAMAQSGPSPLMDDVLNVSAANGIIAVNDGGTWPGVTNLGLPYP